MRKILVLALFVAPLAAQAGVIKTAWTLSPDKVVCHAVPAVVFHPKKDAHAAKKAAVAVARVLF